MLNGHTLCVGSLWFALFCPLFFTMQLRCLHALRGHSSRFLVRECAGTQEVVAYAIEQ